MDAGVRPLRIAFNHTRLEPSGGVEGYIASLLGYLLDRGHSVDFFGGKIRLRIEHPGFRLVRVPYLRSPRPLRVASFALLSHRRIAREERRRPYDVVQGFSRTYYHTLYRDGAGCRQDYCELYLDRLARRGPRRLYYRWNPVDWLVRRIERARYVDRPQRMVIAISSFVRDQILRRYPVPPESVRVVYSGVDCDRFHPRLREEGRARIAALFPPAQASGGPRHLAFVGNDYHRKGLDLLLEALAALLEKRGPGAFRLAVVGGDARAPAYERLARELGLGEVVRFLGKRSDVPELLAGSDALVLPSHFDAYANVSSEALASGTPVIASITSGAAELIRPGHGWVVDPLDAARLARRIDELLATGDLSPLRDAARRAALELSWDKHYREIEGIYYELAAETTREPVR
ncbi:MAG: glycosyltransferase family 4 protein [Planctomycetes bacterium]|nr:glycosyltransferase family 4 protein [Planctomycetota bacterium]